LSFNGQDVLRSAPAGVSDVLQTACFPLVPYANRIAQGRFAWNGSVVELPVLARFAPHAIHGVGWQRAWQVGEVSDRAVVLSLEAGGDAGWPWRFRAEQRIALTKTGLRIDLRLINRDEAPMPAGLGLHPYFVPGTAGELRLTAQKVWLSDETLIPVGTADPSAVCDFAQGTRLPARTLVDHCYEGWDGSALLQTTGQTVTVKADSAQVHIYIPPEGGFCCVEPVTHRPDALNAQPGEPGMPIIDAGWQVSLRMEISATPRAPTATRQ
jgi:aldose 1-epimerase